VTTGELTTLTLSYILWPLLTLALAGLWLAAAVDIARHRRGGTFTGAKLLGMAGAVSVVAVIAIAGVGATFGGQWADAVSATSGGGGRVDAREGIPARSYIFSFGLEHASDSSPADPKPQRGQGPLS
jgi:hypothetical protein